MNWTITVTYDEAGRAPETATYSELEALEAVKEWLLDRAREPWRLANGSYPNNLAVRIELVPADALEPRGELPCGCSGKSFCEDCLRCEAHCTCEGA